MYSNWLANVAFISLLAMENFYINRRWELSGTISSTILSNCLTVMLIVNNELVMALKPLQGADGQVKDNKAVVSAFFGIVNMDAESALYYTEMLTWTIFLFAIASIIFTITSYQLYRSKYLDISNWLWTGLGFTPEQASIQVAMILLKAVVQVT